MHQQFNKSDKFTVTNSLKLIRVTTLSAAIVFQLAA